MMSESRYRYFTEDGVRWREDRDTGQARRADTQDWDRRDGDPGCGAP